MTRASDAAMPCDAAALQHRAGQRVLGLDGPLQQVVLLGEEAAEDRLGDRDERHRVGDLEQREPGLLGRRRQGPRHLVVAEPQPEPEPGESRVDQSLEVGALLRGRGADGRPGREQDLAALQPRRRILELGAVDPPDGPADARLAGDEPEREPGDVQDVADGERHGSDCTNRTEGRPRPDGRAARDWTARTNGATVPWSRNGLTRRARPPHTRHRAGTRGGDPRMDIPQERKVVTEIPGPRSREWSRRRTAAVPTGRVRRPSHRHRARLGRDHRGRRRQPPDRLRDRHLGPQRGPHVAGRRPGRAGAARARDAHVLPRDLERAVHRARRAA